MNKTASVDHEWVWTELTESPRGIKYPASEIRQNGGTVWENYRTSCPLSWVEKGYVREARKEPSHDPKM